LYSKLVWFSIADDELLGSVSDKRYKFRGGNQLVGISNDFSGGQRM